MTYMHKVLLIEDDEFTRFMMREIISGLGVEVEIASNGDEGCKLLEKQPGEFGLVLMDLHMPVMSGIDATLKIRNEVQDPPSKVPIIAVTADVTYHNSSRVAELGMNGFTPKPVSPGTLLSLIDQYCAA
ncbi:response regulator [uncultured Tateyamaria sp.]|uniref:response regulator n=1 Tax=Tateyamaria sp. 1078 TaxID=3417464 RepID=UPI00261FF3D8|nr:response regulator [uncultured Tateyamaria sp.]